MLKLNSMKTRTKLMYSILGLSLLATSIPNTTFATDFTETTSIATDMISLPSIVSENSVNGTYTIIEDFEQHEDSNGVAPIVVDELVYLKLPAGEYYDIDFKVDKFFGTDHNSFTTRIMDVTGTYKYMVIGSDGYKYTSPERSTDDTFTTTNASSGVEYRVMILNTNAIPLTCTAHTFSFIK
ncbi:MAG: hypothetical protein ATN35_05380 [Epulopiscium sp. Nele67-Bin004]|nr:MAG: hypothetical protein ATN35_05380 [Epulopiscium sp. Nele67-Bin004]